MVVGAGLEVWVVGVDVCVGCWCGLSFGEDISYSWKGWLTLVEELMLLLQ